MSYARCEGCGALIDTDDPESATGDKFVCGFCRGDWTWDEAVQVSMRLYDRMRAKTPPYDVDRKTYRGD